MADGRAVAGSTYRGRHELGNGTVPVSQFHDAIRSGDASEVRDMLDADPQLVSSVDVEIDSGNLPLHIAVKNSHLEITQILLEGGADVDARIDASAKAQYDYTALHLAAVAGNAKIADLLLKHGAAINCKGRRDWTPLHFAADRGDVVMVGLLIENGADLESKGQDDSSYYGSKNFNTPLLQAIWKGHKEVVEMLLRNNADVTSSLAMMYAKTRGGAGNGILELLIAYNAAPISSQAATPPRERSFAARLWSRMRGTA